MSKARTIGQMALAASGAAAIVLAVSAQASTIGYWRFEDGGLDQAATTTIFDSSGNSLNGTPINGPIYRASVADNPIPRTGAANTLSLQFNGTTQRIFVPDSPLLQLTHSLTLEAYIDVYDIASRNLPRYVVFRGDDREGLDPYFLSVWQDSVGNNLLTFLITDAANVNASVTVAFPGFNQWMHVAGTLDDATGQMSLYIDGTLAGQNSTSIRPFGTLTGPNPGLGIGNTQSGSYNQYFDGLIDEVRISDVALQPNQFLEAPEPSTICVGLVGLVGLGLVGLLRGRRQPG